MLGLNVSLSPSIFQNDVWTGRTLNPSLGLGGHVGAIPATSLSRKPVTYFDIYANPSLSFQLPYRSFPTAELGTTVGLRLGESEQQPLFGGRGYIGWEYDPVSRPRHLAGGFEFLGGVSPSTDQWYIGAGLAFKI